MKKDKILTKCIEYFQDDTLAANVWLDKYALKNRGGELLETTPKDMFARLASEFSRIEDKYPNPISKEELYDLLNDFKYIIPGGSILYGVGNDHSYSSLGNCFVIGSGADSYGGICKVDEEQVQLMKRRAGVGHDLSHIRPKGSLTSNSAHSSTGVIPFMRRYSNSTLEVAQEGRRGALMETISVEHPDIFDFISAKEDKTKITGANISVKSTDEFMKSVKNDTAFNLEFNGKVHRTIKARRLFDKIAYHAHKDAEPGMIFIDTIIKESPADCYDGFKTISTNPCGEIPLCQYDSCRLISINLYSFVINPFTKDAEVDFDKLYDVAYKAQKMMDDVIDLEYEKIKRIYQKIESDPEADEIKQTEKELWKKIGEKLVQGRRTGLSGIGAADVFASLCMSYGSRNSIRLAKMMYQTIAVASYTASVDMAKDRGSFPIFDFFKEQHNPFVNRIMDLVSEETRVKYLGYGRRNIANLTIPPSGSISLLAGISSGIEPVYSVAHKRRRKVESNHPNATFKDKTGIWWEEYAVVHNKFLEWLRICKYPKLNIIAIRKILNRLSEESLNNLIKESPYYGSTSYEIDFRDKIKLQASVQEFVDHAISNTLNMKEDASVEDVKEAYMLGWTLGCKGITVYRDGSRQGVLITSESIKDEFVEKDAPKRPKDLICDIFYPSIKGEHYLVLVGLYHNKPYEVFCFKNPHNFKVEPKGITRKVSKGIYNLISEDGTRILMEDITSFFDKPEEEFATRAISTALRHGTPVRFMVEQLNKAEGDIFSYSKVIARTLKKYILDGITVSSQLCPQCSHVLIYKGGCADCENCGWSKC